jgi:small subunit ribosomal protein S20
LANSKQQEKRIRQAEKARVRNKSRKTEVKTYIRRFLASLEEGNREQSDLYMAKAVKSLDKAASDGVIHKNNAANHKSRMARRYSKVFPA